MLLAMAVSITLLANEGAAPDTRVVPNGFMSSQQCEAWVRNMRTEKSESLDPASGRLVVGRYFQCVPVRPDEMQTSLQAAISSGR